MILLIRHCSAAGQEPEAKLTEKGLKQALDLSKSLPEFFKPTRIITSPFKRAIESVSPLAKDFDIEIECDELLKERFLCDNENDFNIVIDHLERSFEDFDYKAVIYGESNRDCQKRAIEFLKKLRDSYTPEQVIIIVSHGNFIASLLNLSTCNPFFSCDQMMSLTNPDIFMLKLSQEEDENVLNSYQRIWNASIGLDVKTRVSARAIILDPSLSKVLLFRLHDKNVVFNGNPRTQPLWITPGGGVEDDEQLLISLERELYEELGLKPEDYIIKGHLWRSENKRMVFKMLPCKVIDNYFLIHLLNNDKTFDFSNWTEEEKTVLTKLKWWDFDEIRSTEDKIVPLQLENLFEYCFDHPIKLEIITEDD